MALYRCAHSAIYGNKFKKVIWRVLLKRASIKYGYEIAPECVIGSGLRLIHRGGVCINLAAVLGEPFSFPLLVDPIVTPWNIVTFSPSTAAGLMHTPPR